MKFVLKEAWIFSRLLFCIDYFFEECVTDFFFSMGLVIDDFFTAVCACRAARSAASGFVAKESVGCCLFGSVSSACKILCTVCVLSAEPWTAGSSVFFFSNACCFVVRVNSPGNRETISSEKISEHFMVIGCIDVCASLRLPKKVHSCGVVCM